MRLTRADLTGGGSARDTVREFGESTETARRGAGFAPCRGAASEMKPEAGTQLPELEDAEDARARRAHPGEGRRHAPR